MLEEEVAAEYSERIVGSEEAPHTVAEEAAQMFPCGPDPTEQ